VKRAKALEAREKGIADSPKKSLERSKYRWVGPNFDDPNDVVYRAWPKRPLCRQIG
jgi:hypothetical protein